jgi:hypothetical protein
MDCAYCHKPTQKTLAVTIPSHPECYECHAPGSFDEKAKVKGDCVVCHTQRLVDIQPEAYDAKLASRAYGAKFSHTEHVKFMDCKACHSIQGGYNQYSPSSPSVKQHNTSTQARRRLTASRKVGAPQGRVLARASRGDPQESATEKRPPMALRGTGEGETVR